MSKIIDEQMGDYLWWCEKIRRMSPVTVATKRSVLERFVRVTEISKAGELTNEVFERWMADGLRRGVGARSANIYNSVVVAWVRYMREMGVSVPVNLALIGKLKEMPARRKFYSADEIARVVDGADEVTGLMIRIMFETGMRIAELCRLRISDFEGRVVRFIGKGKKPREVYVTAETLERVLEYVRGHEITDYLWCVWEGEATLDGRPPSVNTVRVWLKRAFFEAGFEGFYPHALRHSFATDLQVRGASVAEIKEMIGHSSVATTERYLHGFEGKMEELWGKYR